MVKTVKFFRTAVIAAALAAALCVTAYADEPTQFVSGTSVNGLGIGGMSVGEAKSHLEGFYDSNYKLTIKKKNGTEEYIKGSDFGYKVTVPEGLSAILDQQNATGRVSGPATDNSHTIQMSVVYDEGALDAAIAALSCLSGSDIVTTQDARLSAFEAGKEFTIIPEVEGNDLDIQKTTAVIKAAVAAGQTEVNLKDSGCYNEVKLRAGDESMTALRDMMNRYRNMTVTYTIGESTETLGGETICSWLSLNGDNQVEINPQGVAGFVQAMAEKYGTSGKVRTFKTVDGRELPLTGPYGWKVNQAEEIQALTEFLKSTDSQTRELSFSQTAAARGDADWGSTYVEIDLAGQHVYMFQEGSLVWEAPCVTGNVSKNYTTPEGIYGLTYKEKDRILRGAKKADGTYEYESHVDYWMPFNGGIGLHDANWRGNFGGSIFQNSGSHGCVNLPPKKVPALYDMVFKGMPVICHN